MRVSGARDSCRHVKIRGFNRASCRASPDRSFWAMLPRDRMRPCTFLDVDNCGDVDMRRGHMGLDGYALIQKLRTLEAERGWSIPALAVTAYARAEDRTRALSSGFQMHVGKPLEPADLVAAITSLLGKDRGAATAGT